MHIYSLPFLSGHLNRADGLYLCSHLTWWRSSHYILDGSRLRTELSLITSTNLLKGIHTSLPIQVHSTLFTGDGLWQTSHAVLFAKHPQRMHMSDILMDQILTKEWKAFENMKHRSMEEFCLVKIQASENCALPLILRLLLLQLKVETLVL